jgi:uncharacterized protein YjbI with pentapeptide repeats
LGGEPAGMRNRVAWALAAILAVVTLGGGVALLKPYWIARYRGQGADLRNAILPFAPLAEARLLCANMTGANLSRADLCWANLKGANLKWVTLAGADLRYANLTDANLEGADLRGANLSDAILCDRYSDFYLSDPNLNNARYDVYTRWPTYLNPKWLGAVKVQ